MPVLSSPGPPPPSILRRVILSFTLDKVQANISFAIKMVNFAYAQQAPYNTKFWT